MLLVARPSRSTRTTDHSVGRALSEEGRRQPVAASRSATHSVVSPPTSNKRSISTPVTARKRVVSTPSPAPVTPVSAKKVTVTVPVSGTTSKTPAKRLPAARRSGKPVSAAAASGAMSGAESENEPVRVLDSLRVGICVADHHSFVAGPR